MAIEYFSPHTYLASILLCYNKKTMLDSFGDQNLFIFPTEIHMVENIDNHCDRHTPLKTLNITIITTV